MCTIPPQQGDIYFTSSSLIRNYKGDSRLIIAPETKIPKNNDRRGFLSSGRASEVDLPRVVYVYKICAEMMVGRKDSCVSTQSNDDVFTRSVLTDSDMSSLDYVHPILNEDNKKCRSASFTGILSPTSGSSDGRLGIGRRKTASALGRKTNRSVPEADTTSTSSTSEYSSHISLEGSVCSSPDSDLQDDVSGSDVRSGRTLNIGTTQHTVGGLHFHLIPSTNT